MRVFKNKWFTRFANENGFSDSELKEIVNQLEKGQFYANLGGGVYKMQLARQGECKSGGYRVIMFFMSKDKTFFQYAFPKSVRDNIDRKELQFYKKMAKTKLAMSETEITNAINSGELIEI